MKITKNGKIELEKNGFRVGNFVFENNEEYIKLSAVSGIFSHQVSTMTALGRFLSLAIEAGNEAFLHGYAATVFNASFTVPDKTFFEEINKACNECVMRHKEICYGVKKDVGDEEDARILDEERKLHEDIEKLKKDLNDN